MAIINTVWQMSSTWAPLRKMKKRIKTMINTGLISTRSSYLISQQKDPSIEQVPQIIRSYKHAHRRTQLETPLPHCSRGSWPQILASRISSSIARERDSRECSGSPSLSPFKKTIRRDILYPSREYWQRKGAIKQGRIIKRIKIKQWKSPWYKVGIHSARLLGCRNNSCSRIQLIIGMIKRGYTWWVPTLRDRTRRRQSSVCRSWLIPSRKTEWGWDRVRLLKQQMLCLRDLRQAKVSLKLARRRTSWLGGPLHVLWTFSM